MTLSSQAMTGGFDPEREFLFPAKPADPEMRESVNMWLWDDGPEFGLPRVGVEGLGGQWDRHEIQMNMSFADGRVLNMYGPFDSHDTIGADGRARVLGSGPLSFELVEPFDHWRVRLDGLATETSVRPRSTDGSPVGAEASRSPWRWRSTSAPRHRRGSAARSARRPGASWPPRRRAT